MKKSRINGRLPERVGLFIDKAIIETRRPMDSSKILPREVNIKKARITVIGEPKIINLRTGESFEIFRRKVLIGLLIDYFGADRVTTSIPITEPETDVLVDTTSISIKTITGKGGVKVSWTVDAPSAREFVNLYSPQCGILFTRINWDMKNSGEPSGLFWISLETQLKILQRLGVDKYLKLPKPGTNPRGIELTRVGLATLLEDEDTLRIKVNWYRSELKYDPYDRWVDYWKRDIEKKDITN